MRIAVFASCVGAMVGLAPSDGLRAQARPTRLVPGPVLVGNGVTDGLGATLGEFFVRVVRPDAGGLESVPLHLLVTSGSVLVDPITCSEQVPGSCATPGDGIAAASGAPTALVGPVMALKLAGAAYVPAGPWRGTSLELALEGSLYASASNQAGDPCEIRLFLGRPTQLLAWAQENDAVSSRRSYRNNTGAGAVIGDSRFVLFPGWLRGRIARNDGVSILVEIDAAELASVRVGDETRTWLIPDLAAASLAGLPAGVFGQVQVNYTGSAGRSYIVDDALSSDVELHATAIPQTSPTFVRGDCNGDGTIEGAVTDALSLLLFNFSGGTPPPCLEACDADGDGSVIGGVADAVYLLQHAYLGGPAPPAPYPGCGAEDPDDELTCDEQGGCP